MYKLVFLLTGQEQQSLAQLNQLLLDELPAKLASVDCFKFSFSLFDDAVRPAISLRIQNQTPTIDAIVFVWVTDKSDYQSIDSAIAPIADVLSAYSLTEYEPIPAPESFTTQGQRRGDSSQSRRGSFSGRRTAGMMQLAFLKVPSDLSYQAWLTTWREEHTQIAIDTQSTFIYRQNVVQECLSQNDLGYTGIVEEAFSEQAMTSQHAFYDVTNDEQLAERQSIMYKSCKRFIDFSDLDVLPTSEYCW